MKKNIGDVDAYIRLAGGFTLLGVGIAKKCTPVIALGAMKITEGMTRFCPVLYLLGLSTNSNGINIQFSKDFSDEMKTD